jgi:hypothetical protein
MEENISTWEEAVPEDTLGKENHAEEQAEGDNMAYLVTWRDSNMSLSTSQLQEQGKEEGCVSNSDMVHLLGL